MRNSFVVLGMCAVLTGLASQASASTITYVTPPGATTVGGPVDASVTFMTSSNQLAITLQNLQANPQGVGQLLSDLFFRLSGDLTAGTLASSSGTEISINDDGTSILGGTVAAGWVLSSSLGTFHLDDLSGVGHAGPEHTIIGPAGPGGLYTAANGSIAGNNAHNPFLNQTALFFLTIPGMTSQTTVTSATFSFGTAAGINVPGVPGGGGGATVPEPATMALFGLGLIGAARRLRSTTTAL